MVPRIQRGKIDEDEFYISVLSVDKKHRGKGIGSLLLRQAVNTARVRNCKSVLLDVYGDNAAALALYEKFGFRIRGEKSSQHPELRTMELVMT